MTKEPSRRLAAKPPPRVGWSRRSAVIALASVTLAAVAAVSAERHLRPVERTQSEDGAYDAPATPTGPSTTVPDVFNAPADEGLARLEQAQLVPFAFTVCSKTVAEGRIRQVLAPDGTAVVDKPAVKVNNRLPAGTTVEVKVSSGKAC